MHFTSALRYPTYVTNLDTEEPKRSNFSGNPKPNSNSFLRQVSDRYLREEMSQFEDAVFLVLGEKAPAVVERVGGDLGIPMSRVWTGMCHPSGTNTSVHDYLLGRKTRVEIGKPNGFDPDHLDRSYAFLKSRFATHDFFATAAAA